jgi:hypothetical protein
LLYFNTEIFETSNKLLQNSKQGKHFTDPYDTDESPPKLFCDSLKDGQLLHKGMDTPGQSYMTPSPSSWGIKFQLFWMIPQLDI